MKPGKLITISENFSSAASTLPPTNPEMVPKTTPMVTAMLIPASPTDSDTRPPYSTRANTSRPR